MKSKAFAAFFLGILAVIWLAGCSSAPKNYSEIPKSTEMKPSEFNPQVLTYRNPDIDIRLYRKVIVMPVEIYHGQDADWEGVSQEEQQELASYLYTDVTKALQEKDLLATQPGPGVARLNLILAGAEKTRPVASTVSHALPIGLALNLGKGAMGKSGSFMGTATVGGDFTDSTTGALVASFLAKEAPNAMDLKAMVSEWDASKKALDKVAQQIADRLEKIRLGEK